MILIGMERLKFFYQKGIMAVEFLLTMALSVVAMFLIFPMAYHWLWRHQFCMIEQNIVSLMEQAKIQSLLKGNALCISALNDGADWSHGVQLKTPKAGFFLVQDDQFNLSKRGLHLIWHGFQSQRSLCFMPDLRARASNGYLNMVWGAYQSRIVINRLGRIKRQSICE